MASIPPARPPYTYLGVATSLMVGIRMLASNTATRGLPFAMLSAHALECLLKAYLSRGGDDSSVQARSVRHDLRRLWEKCVADGLQVGNVTPDWVLKLGNLHGWPYRLRYSTDVHGLVIPPAAPIVAALEELLNQVRIQLGHLPDSAD